MRGHTSGAREERFHERLEGSNFACSGYGVLVPVA